MSRTLDYIQEEHPDAYQIDGYDDAIVGWDEETGRLIYDYQKIVEIEMKTNNCTLDAAIDWVEYNTIPSLPYVGEMRPIIMHFEDAEIW